MKVLKNAVMGAAVFAMIISLSGLAFAEMGQSASKKCKCAKVDKEACAAQIKTLKDSATALQTSNPTLAKGLNDLVDKEAAKLQKRQDWQAKHDAKIKLLKDSAMALNTSNPALAQELQKMSEKKHMEKEAMGKEETGKNTESMQE